VTFFCDEGEKYIHQRPLHQRLSGRPKRAEDPWETASAGASAVTAFPGRTPRRGPGGEHRFQGALLPFPAAESAARCRGQSQAAERSAVARCRVPSYSDLDLLPPQPYDV
jgi:hypothetical protein